MNISKLLKEPLLHFLVVGAALFFIYYTTAYRPDLNKSGDVIVISSSDIERLAYLFEKTWKRPPKENELKG
ncbi:MAG: peptidyl-prolyl cis-trans isomerase, partial [Candidatus Dadabacteria bacterium]|nr:peptidyl-prolyl cis-trans isomerase [Candidatus Dadabacteria bacterium]